MDSAADRAGGSNSLAKDLKTPFASTMCFWIFLAARRETNPQIGSSVDDVLKDGLSGQIEGQAACQLCRQWNVYC